jgi:hypothetical protein
MFTTILNKRIELLCDDNAKISDAQFGFRKGCSTVDAIYILMSVVQHVLYENKRLYVVYVDLLKCFDSIYRNALWLKMYKSGIKGKLLRIIKICMKLLNLVLSRVHHTLNTLVLLSV